MRDHKADRADVRRFAEANSKLARAQRLKDYRMIHPDWSGYGQEHAYVIRYG